MKRGPISVLKYALGMFVVLALLIGGSWVFRIPLSEKLIHTQFRAMGIAIENIEIEAVSPWRLDIRNLRFGGNNRLQQGAFEIEWSNLFSPSFRKIGLKGLELVLKESPEGLKWDGLAYGQQGVTEKKSNNRDNGLAQLPEIQVLDSAVNFHVASLPPIVIEIKRGSVFLQTALSPEGLLAGSIALRELSVVLPAAGISFDGVEFSAKTETVDMAPQNWSIAFYVENLSHLADFPALQPLTVNGVGKLTTQRLTVDTHLHQPSSGIDVMLHISRDSETGEGEGRFGISPVAFQQGSLEIGDVSPLLARNLTRLSGKIQASGNILFNNAWATPVQISAIGKNLVVGMNSSLPTLVEEVLTLDFRQSRLDLSLPPLSPERGWATLEVNAGSLRYGEEAFHELNGIVNFLSLWPLTCPPRHGVEPVTTTAEKKIETAMANCFYDSFALGR